MCATLFKWTYELYACLTYAGHDILCLSVENYRVFNITPFTMNCANSCMKTEQDNNIKKMEWHKFFTLVEVGSGTPEVWASLLCMRHPTCPTSSQIQWIGTSFDRIHGRYTMDWHKKCSFFFRLYKLFCFTLSGVIRFRVADLIIYSYNPDFTHGGVVLAKNM